MSAGPQPSSLSPGVQTPPVQSPLVQSRTMAGSRTTYAEVVESGLGKVGRSIKFNDVVAIALMLVSGMVGYLLLLAVVDHWFFDLTPAWRWMAFGVLVFGVAGYFTMRLWPALVRGINPLYSARTIEQSEPGFRNSLINFVLVRTGTQRYHTTIRGAIERQAANRLSEMDVSAAMDRTWTVRTTFLMASMIVAFGLYFAISPKDPFQTVARVLAPWSDIARPSRVKILDVAPGDVEVFEGTSLTITARVESADDDEEAHVVYSSSDSQVTDLPVAMHREPGTRKYAADLPPDRDGIFQDLTYSVQSGDAVAGPFHVYKIDALSMVVQAVDYAHPSYTGLKPVTVEHEGDIKALEGTRVTIRAQANQEIEGAYLEFDPLDVAAADLPGTAPAAADEPPRRHTLPMTVAGRQAYVSFDLRLSNDRKTPQCRNYQLHFSTPAGDKNEQPILHTIEVLRDLKPHVEILRPPQRLVEVPLDGQQNIEVRALDPDFALSKIALRAITGGDQILDESLLAQPAVGQTTTEYQFRPADLDLQVGDLVVYWAVAEDNRVDTVSAAPAPSVSRTVNYKIRIVEPGDQRSDDRPDDTPADEQENGQSQSGEGRAAEPPEGGQPTAGGKQEGGNSENEAEAGQSDGDGEGETSENETGENETGENGTGENGTGENETGENEVGENRGQAGANGQDQSGKQHEKQNGKDSSQGLGEREPGQPSDASDGSDGGEVGQPTPRESKSPSTEGSDAGGSDAGGSDAGGDDAGGSDAGGSDAGGSDAGGSDAGGSDAGGDDESHDGGDPGESGQRQSDKTQSGANREGVSETGGDAEEGSGGSGQQQGEPQSRASSSDDGEPLPNDGTREGDVFERMLEHIRKETGLTPGNHQPKDGGECADGQCEKGGDGKGEGKADGSAQHSQSQSGTDESGNPRGGDVPLDSERPPGETGSEAPPGGVGQNGSSGAGNKSQQDTGSSVNDEVRRPNQKNEVGDSKQDANNKSKVPSVAMEKEGEMNRERDRRGGGNGDTSGGGDEGGGQGANQPGRDSAGTNTPSDKGSGAANEKGAGETSDQAGDDQQSSGETGQSGEQAGNGSETKSGTGKGESGDQTGQPSQGGQASGGEGGQPGGAAQPGDGQGSGAGGDGSGEPGGDEVNLDYARKATDLVLDYLKNNRDQVDEDFLDKLGDWTQEDLDRFARRWEEFRSLTGREVGDGRERQETLEDTLRGLGLSSESTDLSRDRRPDRTRGGVSDDGVRSQPPRQFLEQYKAFLKSNR